MKDETGNVAEQIHDEVWRWIEAVQIGTGLRVVDVRCRWLPVGSTADPEAKILLHVDVTTEC